MFRFDGIQYRRGQKAKCRACACEVGFSHWKREVAEQMIDARGSTIAGYETRSVYRFGGERTLGEIEYQTIDFDALSISRKRKDVRGIFLVLNRLRG